MSVPVWCADLAAMFWAGAGSAPPFPRDLRRSVTAGFPVTVVPRPDLSVAVVLDWFRGRGIPIALAEADRPLRACLFAAAGCGFIFVDEADDATESRFSLAHEIGHFLRDYWHPRVIAVNRLGPGVLEVFDGIRLATAAERLHAVVRGVRVGPVTHLLRRDDSGQPLSAAEREAEAAADRLAFELLAPAGALSPSPLVGEGRGGGCGQLDHPHPGPPPSRGRASRVELIENLVESFGLPPGPAARYAAILTPEPAPVGRFVTNLLRS